jgi:hypothetical protein
MAETTCCPECSKEFSYEYQGGRPRTYCPECRPLRPEPRRTSQEARNVGREMACSACSVAFQPTSNRQRFCPGCGAAHRRDRPAPSGPGNPRPRTRRRADSPPLTRECAACGERFTYEKRGARVIRYCSRACSNRHTGAGTGQTQSRKVTLPCTQCGDLVTGSPAHMNRKDVKFCSRSCFAKYAASGVIIRECRACGNDFSTRSGNHTWCTPCRKTQQNREARLIVARHGMKADDFRQAGAYREIIASDPCVWCGGAADTVDHIQPIARGGTDRWDNYAPACLSCNSAKNTRTLLVNLMRLANRGQTIRTNN